jgi:putative membrane protein
VIALYDLPTLNATLNGTSAIALLTGYYFIRRRKIAAHRACMIAAAALSILFLVSYTVYHHEVGFTRFTGQGWVRTLYFAILIPHTILAVVAVVPLVVVTLTLALRERFNKHRRIARWTLPIWLFVSVTGVVIYWMLYHLT